MIIPITGITKIINKETGEEINDIKIKKNPINNEDIYIKENIKDNEPRIKEIISLNDPNTGKEILI